MNHINVVKVINIEKKFKKKRKRRRKISKYHKLHSKYQKYIHLFNKIILILFFTFFFLHAKSQNEYKNKIKYKSNTTVCICAIGKKENLYIKEFVQYYKKLGYNHIFLYDNNDINDERFEEVIQNEINEDFVSIINYRGYRGMINKPQLDAYIDCYEKNNKNYSWLSFYDIDEFLELKPNNITIQEFLDNERYKKCQNIKINWVEYTDNDLIHYENKSVIERFTSKSLNNYEKIHIKSTPRGNLSHNYWNNSWNPHSSVDKEFIACSSSGNITSSTNYYVYPPDYTYAFLRHYPTKSIEEYFEKLKKGRADLYFKVNSQNIKKKFDYYFSVNNKTKLKVDLFNKEYNVNFSIN